MGRFCFCFFASTRLMRVVLMDGILGDLVCFSLCAGRSLLGEPLLMMEERRERGGVGKGERQGDARSDAPPPPRPVTSFLDDQSSNRLC